MALSSQRENLGMLEIGAPDFKGPIPETKKQSESKVILLFIVIGYFMADYSMF